jgi:hypothetical protein
MRRIGSLAVAAASGRNGSSRREVVAAQLPMVTWPEKRVLIVAVNAETGQRRAFDSDSGIDLVDAVIASTAFFGWPPTLFQGEHYSALSRHRYPRPTLLLRSFAWRTPARPRTRPPASPSAVRATHHRRIGGPCPALPRYALLFSSNRRSPSRISNIAGNLGIRFP